MVVVHNTFKKGSELGAWNWFPTTYAFPAPVKKSRHFCPVRKSPFNYWLSVVCNGVSRSRKLVRSCAQAYRTVLSLIGPRRVQGILEQLRNHSEINRRRTLRILGHVTDIVLLIDKVVKIFSFISYWNHGNRLWSSRFLDWRGKISAANFLRRLLILNS